jgi:hypothetical protein
MFFCRALDKIPRLFHLRLDLTFYPDENEDRIEEVARMFCAHLTSLKTVRYVRIMGSVWSLLAHHLYQPLANSSESTSVDGMSPDIVMVSISFEDSTRGFIFSFYHLLLLFAVIVFSLRVHWRCARVILFPICIAVKGPRTLFAQSHENCDHRNFYSTPKISTRNEKNPLPNNT